MPKKCAKGCGRYGSFNVEGESDVLYCKEDRPINSINLVKRTCIKAHCTRGAHYDVRGRKERPRFCAKDAPPGSIDKYRCCQYKTEQEQCSKIACYNFAGNKKGLRCFDHRLEGHVNVTDRKCEKCTKIPYYNFPGNRQGRFCKDHTVDDCIDVRNKRCSEEGCPSLNPNFRLPSATTVHNGLYCKRHAPTGSINIHSKLCAGKDGEACLKQPRFNIKGEKKGILCKDHAPDHYVNVVDRTCLRCDKIPCFNLPGRKRGLTCEGCALEGYVNVKAKQCSNDDCTSQPRYNLPGLAPETCHQHRRPGMIANPRRKCVETKCGQLAQWGILHAEHCDLHKEQHEINLVERKCQGCQLSQVLNRFDFCEFCCPELFQRRYKVKEKATIDYLKANGLEPSFQDVVLNNGICGRERPDAYFVNDTQPHWVNVEHDEFQHRERECSRVCKCNVGEVNCKCDITRMKNLAYGQGGGRPGYHIRFNSDPYKPQKKGEKMLSDIQRYQLLVRWIKHLLVTPPTEFCQVVYLCYDNFSISNIEIETLIAFDKE